MCVLYRVIQLGGGGGGMEVQLKFANVKKASLFYCNA